MICSFRPLRKLDSTDFFIFRIIWSHYSTIISFSEAQCLTVPYTGGATAEQSQDISITGHENSLSWAILPFLVNLPTLSLHFVSFVCSGLHKKYWGWFIHKVNETCIAFCISLYIQYITIISDKQSMGDVLHCRLGL